MRNPRFAWKQGLAVAAAGLVAVAGLQLAPTAAGAVGLYDDEWSYQSQFGGRVAQSTIDRVPKEVPVMRTTAPDPNGLGPAILYAYVNAGETVSSHFGGRSFAGALWTPAKETWDIGAAYAFWTIVDPSGNVLQRNDGPRLNESTGSTANGLARNGGAWYVSETNNSGQPADFTATESGVYAFAVRNFNYGNYRAVGFPWDISITSSGVEQSGRVWVEELGISDSFTGTGGPSFANNGANYRFNLLAENGYQYALELNGYHGMNTQLSPNAFGNAADDCTPIYKSVAQTAAPGDCGGKYRVFFETPDTSLPAAALTPRLDSAGNWQSEDKWVLPQLSEQGLTVIAEGDGTPAAPLSRTLKISSNGFIGTSRLEVDADGDGKYGGSLDRSFPLAVESAYGELIIDFDGLDANGVAIPADRIVRVRAAATNNPEIHVRLFDSEQIKDGISLTRLNGAGIDEDRVYWDDSDFAGSATCSTDAPGTSDTNPVSTAATDGVLAAETNRAHRWTSTGGCLTGTNWGQDRWVDHWSYGKSAVASEVVFLGEKPTYAVGDFVWIDLNHDGIQDSDEPALAGVEVQAHDAKSGALIGSATSDADGTYVIDELPEGDYNITFALTPDQAELYEFTAQSESDDARDSNPNSDGLVTGVSLDASNTAIETHTDGASVRATHGIIRTIDAGLKKREFPFTLQKKIEGDGANLVPADSTFSVDYTFKAGSDFAGGSGKLTLSADGTPIASDPVPLGAAVEFVEQTPAPIAGGTWKPAKYSHASLELSSAGLSATVTNTFVLEEKVVPPVDPEDPKDPEDPQNPTDPKPPVKPADPTVATKPGATGPALANTGLPSPALPLGIAGAIALAGASIVLLSARRKQSKIRLGLSDGTPE